MVAELPTILHVDMDAYYASIEIRDRPELAGLPVCVGGTVQQRGVIAAASYAARKFGVHSAMPTATALRLCPKLVLLPPDFERYTRESRRIMAIFQTYTPLVEPLSLDEAFLDVKGCEHLFGDALAIGHAIRRDILRQSGLVASVGIATSKFVAKLASDLCKPDGLRLIAASEVQSVLSPLPVSAIFGVGPRTAKRLESMGILTVGELASMPRAAVLARFGSSGAWIHDLAHGVDPRRVHPHREEKSISVERTFPEDLSDRSELRRRLLEFSEELAWRLRASGLRGRTVALKARYWDFRTVTRTKTLDMATHLGPRIYTLGRELLERVPHGPMRLLGLMVSGLEDVRAPRQTSLFGSVLRSDDSSLEEGNSPASATGAAASGTRPLERGFVPVSEAKLERVSASMDQLRRKHGRPAVVPASLLGEDLHGSQAPAEGVLARTLQPQHPQARPQARGRKDEL